MLTPLKTHFELKKVLSFNFFPPKMHIKGETIIFFHHNSPISTSKNVSPPKKDERTQIRREYMFIAPFTSSCGCSCTSLMDPKNVKLGGTLILERNGKFSQKLQFSEKRTLEAHRKRCHNTFPVERKRTPGLSTIPEDFTFPPNQSLIVNSLLRNCPIRTSFFSGSKNPHCGKKVWSEPDSDLAYLGGSKNPHGGKESIVRTRLHLSVFGWIEKSTRWKRKYGPNPTSTQPIWVDRKIHTVEKKHGPN